MPIYTRTSVTAYCDGSVHLGSEFTVSGDKPVTEAKAFLRQRGWVIKKDGTILCPLHAKEKK